MDPNDTPSGVKRWRDRTVDGDVNLWQVKLDLPHLSSMASMASPEFPIEVGGDFPIGPGQERAIQYLVDHEPEILRRVLAAVAADANRMRADGYFDGGRYAPGELDQLLPIDMTPVQAAERIRIDKVYVTGVAPDGMAYLQVGGLSDWGGEHGFDVVLHGDRLVLVAASGEGWIDPVHGVSGSNAPE